MSFLPISLNFKAQKSGEKLGLSAYLCPVHAWFNPLVARGGCAKGSELMAPGVGLSAKG